MVKTELDLQELGNRIGMVDQLIVILLAKRIRELAIQVERYKRVHGEPIIRPNIEKNRLDAVQALAQENGLDPDFVRSVFWAIIAETGKVQIKELQSVSQETELSTDILKKNLLALTEEIAPLYDKNYGSNSFATNLYMAREQAMLTQIVEALKGSGNTSLAVDLGCATGRMTFRLAGHFKKVVGYDISPAMIAQAQANLDGNLSNIMFQVADIEESVPQLDNSVSFVLMNLGTASDVLNIQRVLIEIKRVLKPNGRFMLSFYNADALLYNCWFLPWPVSLAAKIDTVNHCLEVRVKDRIFLVPAAKPYTKKEVISLLKKEGLRVSEILTYPTVSSILPHEFFKDKVMQKSIGEIDERLTRFNMGAYILVTGKKTI